MSTDNDISDERLKEIERFLQHEMTAEEQDAFEKKMMLDKHLQEQVNELSILFLGIQESALHVKLNEFHKEIAAPASRNWHFKKWLIAASVIVCVFSAWWYWRPEHKGERLFARYFTPDPGLISGMGNSDNYIFDRAMIDYKTGHYKEAIQAWKGLQIPGTYNDTLNYFIGIAYLSLKESKAAIPYFEKVVVGGNTVFKDEANWYLGLALLYEEKIKEALPYIQQSSHKGREELESKLK